MNQKAALFDLDGVLLDSEGIYTDFWAKQGPKYGVTDPNFAYIIKGTTLKQILDKYFSPDMHERMKKDIVDFENTMRYTLFPGVMKFLHDLKAHGIPMAIVTSSGEKKMRTLFAQLPDFASCFSALITDADVQRSKPDPQGYLLAAERLGADPKDCYVFEDSYSGLLAGRRSGAKVIALATTNPADTLHDKADIVLPGFEGWTTEKMLAL